MNLNQHRVRRLITMSLHEREVLLQWFKMADVNERDEDFIVILEALNDRARKLASERKADLDARHGKSAERELAYARELATGVLGVVS
jgi:hypothetical protein